MNETKKGSRGILWRVLFFLTGCLFLAVLELGKFTAAGWVLAAAVLAGFYLLRRNVLKEASAARRLLSWLGLAAALGLVLWISYPPVRRVPAVSGRDPRKTGIVTVAQGHLRGVYTPDGAVEVYAGIPYAEPPVGDLRWKEPQPKAPWEGILEADHFAPMSMQTQNGPLYSSLAQIIGYHDYEIRPDDDYRPPASEDSLYLNIWKPAGDVSGLPVLVYVHGGSLQTGQPWYADYSGEGLARLGAVVVNMGYRLGIFGFFADEALAAESPNHTTGNYGLLDQIQALRWVKENIAAFGGDPDNVTLAGESAGAASVSALCTSPLAKGLFRRAVLESSTVASPEPPHSFRLWEEAVRSGNELKARYQARSLAEFRALPADNLVGEADTQHHMTIDGYALTELPYESYRAGRYNGEALLHGFNREESAPFIIFAHARLKNYEKRVRSSFGEYADEVLALFPASTDEEADRNWADIFSAAYFTYSHYCLTRLAAANGLPVYEYFFTKENGRLGTWHSGEEVYLYGNIPADSRLYGARDYALSDQMRGYFVNFIRTGDPNGGDLPRWEKSTDGRMLLELGEEVRPAEDPFLKLYGILDKMQGFGQD